MPDPVSHESQRYHWRRRCLVIGWSLIPVLWVGLSLLHAALLCSLGWRARFPTHAEMYSFYVDTGPGGMILTDANSGRPPPWSPLALGGAKPESTRIFVHFEVVTESARMAPHRTDLDRTKSRVWSEPELEAISVDVGGSFAPLDEPQLAQTRNAILREMTAHRSRIPHLYQSMKHPLVYGTTLTREGCPSDALTSIRFGLWALAAGPLALLIAHVRMRVGEHRRRRGRCAWCSHPISGGLCTECGTIYLAHTATM